MSRTPLILSLVLVAACRSGGFQGGVYSKPGVRYAVAPPGTGWKPVSLDDNDLAWVSTSSEHSLAVDSTCDPGEDAPLEILTTYSTFRPRTVGLSFNRDF
jgi:hypothetical protein